MAKVYHWSSQSLDEWAKEYVARKSVKPDRHPTHYIEKGEGEPVILLRGFSYNLYIWNKNLDTLANRLKVYAFDLSGFGYSTREQINYGYPLYADHILRFMDTLNIERDSLVG